MGPFCIELMKEAVGNYKKLPQIILFSAALTFEFLLPCQSKRRTDEKEQFLNGGKGLQCSGETC